MKKIAKISAIVIAMGSALVTSTGAQAATVGGTFNVNITLTPICEITTAAAAMTFAYTSFQAGAQAATGGGFSLKCTTGLTPTSFALDSTSVTDDATNLAYTISLPTPLAGNGAPQAYAVTGSMAGGQVGTCALNVGCNNNAATNKIRTLTITY